MFSREGFFRWPKLQIRLSLRSHLILLVLISMVPLLIFATFMVVRLSQADRDTFRRGAQERTLALITAVDTELKGSVDTLQGLAASDHLDTGDLVSFREDAERILKSQPDWRNIHLAEASGEQLMDLLHAPGSHQGMVEDRREFEDIVRTTHPVIGNVRLARKDRITDFVIQVPVMRDGVLKYVLSASVAPEQINSLLLRQKIPENWTGSVIDGNGRFVARTAAMKESLGQLAPNRFRAALSRAAEGWIRGKSREGQNIYIPYNRSPFSGWTVGLAIPAASVDAILHRSLYYTIFIGVAFLALGIALAWLLSNRTARSIEGLSHLAEGLGLHRETTNSSSPTPIAEVEVVRGVLINATRLIQERSNERDLVEASLRRLGNRLELAQEAANIGTFEGNLETNLVEWSPSMEKLYGITPGQFGGTYDDWKRLMHPDDVAAAEAALRNCIETMDQVDMEYRIIRSDNAVRWVAARARLIADGQSRRMVGVNIDITERKRAEEELRDATSKLHDADRRKDEFLAMLGHELRNPLSVISMTVQLLRSQGLSETKSAELPEIITAQVSHMARLVDDLLDVSRITRGQIQLNTEPCDLTALAHEALEEQRPLLARGGLSLRSELAEESLWVIGDSTRLKQVLGNGLQNANKFTDRGGTITVMLRKDDGTSSAVLTIRDTGVGMDAAILKRAFEPFSQAERTIKRSRSGLGLGLALVKGIIDLHYGSVRLHSDGPGTGSELTIRLPLTDLQSTKPVISTAESTFRSRRILLIEDNPTGARAMRMVLAGIGHEVEVAHSGEDGIEAAQRFQPEIVLCDIDLPGIDGFAVAKALRRQPITAEAELIALSGYGQVEYQRRAVESGFNAYLTKPVNIGQLTATLSRATPPSIL